MASHRNVVTLVFSKALFSLPRFVASTEAKDPQLSTKRAKGRGSVGFNCRGG